MIKGIKLHWVGTFTLLALAMLFIGQDLYDRYGVEKPLNQAIASVAQGASVQYRKDGPRTVVEVSQAKLVDLGDSYRHILKVSRERFGQNVRVQIGDQPDIEVEKVWAELQFPVYQGIATGNYTEMKKQADGLIGNPGNVSAKLSMDNENVYVQIEKGDYYIYRVVPRDYGGDYR